MSEWGDMVIDTMEKINDLKKKVPFAEDDY